MVTNLWENKEKKRLRFQEKCVYHNDCDKNQITLDNFSMHAEVCRCLGTPLLALQSGFLTIQQHYPKLGPAPKEEVN